MTQTPENRFIETLGLISQTEGMPPISGRILGYLVLADDACSLTDIAEALDISKASASTNVRLLEAKGIARREGKRGSRQDHWAVDPQPQRSLLDTLALRFRKNAETIDEIAEDFRPDQAKQREKVEEFSNFYRQSADFMAEWASTLDAHAPPPAAPARPAGPRR